MPIDYQFDLDRRLLLTRMSGPITTAELLEYTGKVNADPAVVSPHDELVDLRDAEATAISSSTLREVAQLFRQADRTPERVRVALVASDDLAYGLARMYQAFRSDSPVDLRVFRTIEDARGWLDSPPSGAATR